MKTTALKLPLAVAFCALALGGCAYHGGPADYHGYQAMGEQTVRYGVVETVREVKIQPRETGVGGATGAMLGSIAGSTMGSHHYHAAGAIAGALLGGLIGQQVERSSAERPGFEVTVQLDSGKYIAVVQDADEAFRSGDRVRILSSRGLTRVTH